MRDAALRNALLVQRAVSGYAQFCLSAKIPRNRSREEFRWPEYRLSSMAAGAEAAQDDRFKDRRGREMDRLERLADRLAIEELNAAFAYHLDHDEVDALVALFTDDALYTNGSRRSTGRREIEAFFRSRTAEGPRTARHFCSGLRVFFDGPDTARGTSVWLTFARNSLPPIDHTIPILIADFDDLYVRETDGAWRIRRRHIEPIFRDPAGMPPGAPRAGPRPTGG